MLQKIGDSVSSWMDAAQAADKTEIRNRGQRHLPLVRKRGRIMGYEPMNESWQMAGERHETLGQYVAKTYLWMFAGLLVTFGIALAGYVTGAILYVFQVPYATLALTGLELLTVIWLSARIHKLSVGAARGLFLFYAALNGVVFSMYFLIFGVVEMVFVFAATALFFGMMAGVSLIFKLDLSGIRPLLVGGLLFLILFGLVIYELMKKGIDAGIRTINGTIQQYIFPALIIIAVVTVVVGEYSLYRLKNVYKEMKDADEDRFYELDYEEEKWGAWTSGVNLVSQVACIIILSFGYSLKYIESGKSRYFLFACIIFILCYFYDIYLSVRYVKAIQAAHPEKKGDPTSSKFTEQWVESCDEAEKEIIYKSAYKTYIVLNKVIPILLLLTLIANMFLNTGILAVLVVAVIYLVTGMTYIRSSMVSKAKRIG